MRLISTPFSSVEKLLGDNLKSLESVHKFVVENRITDSKGETLVDLMRQMVHKTTVIVWALEYNKSPNPKEAA